MACGESEDEAAGQAPPARSGSLSGVFLINSALPLCGGFCAAPLSCRSCSLYRNKWSRQTKSLLLSPQNLGERNALPFYTAAAHIKWISSDGKCRPRNKSQSSFSFFALGRVGCRRRVIVLNYATAAGPLFSESSLAKEFLRQFLCCWERRVIPNFEATRGLLQKCLVALTGTRPPFSKQFDEKPWKIN